MIVAEEERLMEVLRLAEMRLNVGQIEDTEALSVALQRGLVERSYTGVHVILAMLALPLLVLTAEGVDYLAERC